MARRCGPRRVRLGRGGAPGGGGLTAVGPGALARRGASLRGAEATQGLLARLRASLEAVRGSGRGAAALGDQAVAVAEDLLRLCHALESSAEAEQRRQLSAMADDPKGCALTALFTDRVPRARSATSAVRTGRQLIARLGVPRYFQRSDRILLRAFGAFGGLQPALAAAAVRRHIRHETARYLLPDEPPELAPRLARLRETGAQVNVNHLGEEVLSAEEAESHRSAYERLLSLSEVDTVSVKISGLCERLSALAFEDGVERISAALRRVYRAAAPDKLVMLDMEAYKDLALSLAAFRQVAGEPEFLSSRVGIVLQAYLPDSHAAYDELLEFAAARVRRGGAPLRVRLVKGANLAMERVLEEQRGWACAVYPSKADVDASFRALLQKACAAEHAPYLVQGVGSHNLFDVALALLLRSSLGAEGHVSFEVLVGMAEPLRRALIALGVPTLLYCPTVAEEQYHTAVAYLVRRLDENTTPENFLCSGYSLSPEQPPFREHARAFLQSCERLDGVPTAPRRRPRPEVAVRRATEAPFRNESDTDFCLRRERERLGRAIAALRERPCFHVPLWIGGQPRLRSGPLGFDPSEPGAEPYRLSLAEPADIEDALSQGEAARSKAEGVLPRRRARWLAEVAALFRAHRHELVALIMLDGGKVAAEADAEVSEAIDFAEYYARTGLEQLGWSQARLRPRGLTVVTPPWNFPLAIPMGGCFAALAVGNPVILKPALETPAVAERAVQLCYEAGVPPELLQLVLAEDSVATPLITDRRTAAVVLTGASDTARLFRRLRPDLYLLAETGGKNTIVVTEHADMDAAVAATVDSAFGHSGQKCSAASLLIVQESVARDGDFLDRLAAATRSRRVGSVWSLEADQGPLIHPPRGPLEQAMVASRTEPEWSLRPQQSAENPRLVTPGIRTGVQPGSLLHQTELFGPIVGIMSAPSLERAVALANDTPYGLTAGLMSLDESEQAYFLEHMDAGNLYVNRATTGAIVQRQPFGGRKTSSFGPGAKAGGPNYTLELVRQSDGVSPEGAELPPVLRHVLAPIAGWLPPGDRDAFWAASASYQLAYRDHFVLNHDPAGLRSQRNVFRYQPAKEVLLWVGEKASPLHFALSLSALAQCQVRFDLAMLRRDVEVERVAALLRPYLREVVGELGTAAEHRAALAGYRRVRCIGEFPSDVFAAKNSVDAYFERQPPLRFGRLELLRYFLEQSVSAEVHRYGNLQGARLFPLGG